MNRILALQGLSQAVFGDAVVADSDQSNHCSSATTACSTQSSFCELKPAVTW